MLTVSDQFQQYGDVYAQQYHSIDVYEDKIHDVRCLGCEKKDGVSHTPLPNLFGHEQFYIEKAFQHVFEIKETHHRHQIYV